MESTDKYKSVVIAFSMSTSFSAHAAAKYVFITYASIFLDDKNYIFIYTQSHSKVIVKNIKAFKDCELL